MDLLADRRGHTERSGGTEGRLGIRQPVCRRRQPREGGLAGGHEHQPCPGHRLRLVQQLDRTGADSDARHDMQPLQGEPQFRIHTILAAACHPQWRHVTRRFFHPATFDDRQKAETAYRSLTPDSSATVTKVERRKTLQQPPLLYDLTALQKDCNVHLDLPAAKTLDIAQSLYEKKLISYPRTGSRYIPHDVMACVPGLLERIMAMPGFTTSAGILDFARLNTRSVDDSKVTDHHALITTGIAPEGLSEAEEAVYTLIAGRMLEAFSPCCEKEQILMECRLDNMDFRSKSSLVVSPGWRGIFRRKEDRQDDEPETDEGTAILAEGDTVPASGLDWPRRRPCPDRSIPKPRCWQQWRPAAGR